MMKWLKNIDKSDRYIFLAYWLVVMPLLLPTFMQNEHSMLHHIFSYFMYAFNVTIIVMFIVYYLFKSLLPKKKYFLMIALLIIGIGVHTLLLDITFATLSGNFSEINFQQVPTFKFLIRIINNGRNIAMLTTLLIAINFYRMQNKVLALEKERKENELRWLKSQVDPHFLFNNLNVLSILIKKDQEKAMVYVDKLSSLFRYLVRQKDQDVVTFSEEWRFAQDYIYLIEQRFGQSYTFIVNFDFDAYREYLIPPASIQMLFENIIKHNEGDRLDPLVINITIKDNKLIVQNELRLKHKVDSTGTGLENLKNRLALLTNEMLEIYKDGKIFRVSIPLVNQLN